MDRRKISIVVNRSIDIRAETIQFKTILLFLDVYNLDYKIETMNSKIFDFIIAKKIAFSGPHMATMDNNGFRYDYPSFILDLTFDKYIALEDFMEKNKELSGVVIDHTVSLDSKEKLIKGLLKEAREQAKEIAEIDGLVLQEEYDFEELSSINRKRTVFPPRSAKINHFIQTLEGNYKFTFIAE